MAVGFAFMQRFRNQLGSFSHQSLALCCDRGRDCEMETDKVCLSSHNLQDKQPNVKAGKQTEMLKILVSNVRFSENLFELLEPLSIK